MKFENMLNATMRWAPDRNTTNGVVLGSLVRMVRNLAGYNFPGWSTQESRKAVADTILPVIKNMRGFKTAYSAEMTELSYGQRRALLTRKQLTPSMAARQDGCHVIIPKNRPILIMVNEEEHLTIHTFQNGYDFDTGIDTLDQLDATLHDSLKFAYTPQHGYLTSIPSEAGDGLQLYSILHLPGLTIANMMNQVTKALEKLHASISPYFSDSKDDTGHLFVLFSIPGPEDSIEEIQENFCDVINHLVRREQQMRRKLLADPGMYLQDAISRAYGLLNNCRRLSIKELRDAISLLRLGTLQGLIHWEENERDMLIALSSFCLDQATITAMAEEHGDPLLCLQRANATREFLINHPHTFSDTPYEQ